jgi:hypothetical protein
MERSAAFVELDRYVVDVLMRDLVGHDKKPSAFLVYLFLAVLAEGEVRSKVSSSLSTIARMTGLSKTAVQGALRHLQSRGLIAAAKTRATAVPEYRLLRHWRRRLA